jgi:hypothetical protein
MLLTCFFCRFIQAALEPAGREKWRATFLRVAGHKEVFHGLEGKKKRNGQGGFYPRADHALLAMPHWDFPGW